MAGLLRSFVAVEASSHFSIQNLPFGAGKVRGQPHSVCLSRIGDLAVNLSVLEAAGLFSDVLSDRVFNAPTLNAFMSQSKGVWRGVRTALQELLSADNPRLRDNADLQADALVPLTEVELTLPVQIGDYTDFYASKNHAYNVGCMMRGPENALQANWLHLPVGYHGRASSVSVSGTPVKRPRGQLKAPDAPAPVFMPTQRLDFELEMGAFIGGAENPLGEPVDIASAEDRIFGLVLLNDWSARDFQAWEYVPLGPFNSKNFLTSISPWIVSLDALEPFRVPLDPQDPVPLPYLQPPQLSSYDINLEVFLKTPALDSPSKIAQSNLSNLYWSLTQQLAHHSVTGCNLRPGDLLGTGTISGKTPDSLGCLLEISLNGKNPLTLPSGENRSYLEDGDELTLRGSCQGDGYVVGFGEVTGKVEEAYQDRFYQRP
jgi:fumarylacetoacetase